MIRILSRLVFALWVVCCAAMASAGPACEPDSVFVKTHSSDIRFTIELAETPAERAQGLMFRESMARSAGMLFVFEHPQRVAFWMKNTLIPLDMVFLDRSGTVTHVHPDAVPGDLTPIPGGDNVYSVLEINAGLAENYGIEPGSMMRHEVFSDGPAAWPC